MARMRVFHVGFVVTAVALFPSCALQATSGVTSDGHGKVRAPLTVGVTTQVPRISEGVVGARLGMAFEGGAAPKHVIVHGGYDAHLSPRVAVQTALELGAGSPIYQSYKSPGAYFGTSVSMRFRLWGTGEEVAYNAVATALELVVAPRAGVWTPPEGTAGARLSGEYAAEAGLRFCFGSDLFSPTRGKVEEPPLEEVAR